MQLSLMSSPLCVCWHAYMPMNWTSCWALTTAASTLQRTLCMQGQLLLYASYRQHGTSPPPTRPPTPCPAMPTVYDSQGCSKSSVEVVVCTPRASKLYANAAPDCHLRRLPLRSPTGVEFLFLSFHAYFYFPCNSYPESDEGQHGSPATHSSAVGLLNHALHLALQEDCDGLGVLSCHFHLILKSHLQGEEEENFACFSQPTSLIACAT